MTVVLKLKGLRMSSPNCFKAAYQVDKFPFLSLRPLLGDRFFIEEDARPTVNAPGGPPGEPTTSAQVRAQGRMPSGRELGRELDFSPVYGALLVRPVALALGGSANFDAIA